MRHPWVKPGEVLGWSKRPPTWPDSGRLRTWLEGLQPGTAAEIYDLGSIVAVQTMSAPRPVEDGTREIKVLGRSFSAEAESWIVLSMVRPPDHRWLRMTPATARLCMTCSDEAGTKEIGVIGCCIQSGRTACDRCRSQVGAFDYVRLNRMGRVVAP